MNDHVETKIKNTIPFIAPLKICRHNSNKACIMLYTLNIILGYSLTRGEELYIWPFEGNHKADVAPGENELDTPDL